MITRLITGTRADCLLRLVYGIAALLSILLAGCAQLVKPEVEPVPTAAPANAPLLDSVEPGSLHPVEQTVRTPAQPEKSLSEPAQFETARPSPEPAQGSAQRPRPEAELAATPALSPAPQAGPTPKSEQPLVKPAGASPAKVVVKPVAPIEPPPQNQSKAAANDATRTEAPTLDLKALEKQLKETKAIGVFTKLSLKNQVDDLLDRFRAFYQGRLKTSLSELRQPYEGLMLKVISLLQDGDPPLARAIAASREGIWSILADPVKFAKVKNGR